MKITSITTEEFRWPRHVPIRNGKHTYTHSGLGIVKIETDEHITGIGLGGTGLVGQATIEGLKQDGKLNAVQEAMVRCQGAQCGFCTPGFVVSMCGLLQEHDRLDEQTMRAGLTGNLCRCTGYEPILKAGLEATTVARVSNPCGALHDPVLIESDSRLFFKATTLADAVEFQSQHPDSVIIAGGTKWEGWSVRFEGIMKNWHRHRGLLPLLKWRILII